MNGILLINKDKGPTSHDVVAKVRKTLKMKKVGHMGTLDPAATGMLPLLLGKATRLSRYFIGADKSYRAVIRLGETTDTLDGDGTILTTQEVNVDEAQIRSTVESFLGKQAQLPPMYSAKKIKGKRLYDLARKGIEVERQPKEIEIKRLEIESIDGRDIQLVVDCTSGTYIRVLAADIGDRIGCGAYLLSLERLSVGDFVLEDACKVEQLSEPSGFKVLSLSTALSGFTTLKLPRNLSTLVSRGHQLNASQLLRLKLPSFKSDEVIVLVSETSEPLAVTRALVSNGDVSTQRPDQVVLKSECVLAPQP